jgi:hypothetical protein
MIDLYSIFMQTCFNTIRIWHTNTNCHDYCEIHIGHTNIIIILKNENKATRGKKIISIE